MWVIYPLYRDNKCLCLIVQCQEGEFRVSHLPLTVITSVCVLLSSVRRVSSVLVIYPLYRDNKCLCLIVQYQEGEFRVSHLPLVP